MSRLIDKIDINLVKEEIVDIDVTAERFIDNMTERGPYLTNPKEIKRYHKTLVD